MTEQELTEHLNEYGHIPEDVVVRCDAVRLLELLPDDSVDLYISDPAYESLEKHRAKGTTTRLTHSKASSNSWFPIFVDERYPSMLAELYRVLRPMRHAYIFCDETTADVLKPMARDAGFWVWKELVWVKTTTGSQSVFRHLAEDLQALLIDASDGRPWRSLLAAARKLFAGTSAAELADGLVRGGMGYHWRASCERILFLEKRSMKQTWPKDPRGRGRKLNNLGYKDVLFAPSVRGSEAYPTEKPTELLCRLIENSSDYGELVVDNFAGSGSTGTSARRLQRRYLLGDISVKSIETCRARGL